MRCLESNSPHRYTHGRVSRMVIGGELRNAEPVGYAMFELTHVVYDERRDCDAELELKPVVAETCTRRPTRGRVLTHAHTQLDPVGRLARAQRVWACRPEAEVCRVGTGISWLR